MPHSDAETAAHIYALMIALLPELWKALPAVIVGLMAFGFKRITTRILGVFEGVKALEAQAQLHAVKGEAAHVANEEAHRFMIAQFAERMARMEHTIDEQARRQDALAARLDAFAAGGRSSRS